MQGIAGPTEFAIQPNMTPPEGAVFTGEVMPDQRLIYKRPKPLEKRSHVEPQRDEKGEPLVWRNPNNGQPVRVMTRRVIDLPLAGEVGPDGLIADEDHPDSWEEFILVPMPNNMTLIETNFRPDPDEAKRLAAVAERQAFEGQLYGAMQEAGLDAKGLIGAIKAAAKKGKKQESPEE